MLSSRRMLLAALTLLAVSAPLATAALGPVRHQPPIFGFAGGAPYRLDVAKSDDDRVCSKLVWAHLTRTEICPATSLGFSFVASPSRHATIVWGSTRPRVASIPPAVKVRVTFADGRVAYARVIRLSSSLRLRAGRAFVVAVPGRVKVRHVESYARGGRRLAEVFETSV